MLKKILKKSLVTSASALCLMSSLAEVRGSDLTDFKMTQEEYIQSIQKIVPAFDLELLENLSLDDQDRILSLLESGNKSVEKTCSMMILNEDSTDHIETVLPYTKFKNVEVFYTGSHEMCGLRKTLQNIQDLHNSVLITFKEIILQNPSAESVDLVGYFFSYTSENDERITDQRLLDFLEVLPDSNVKSLRIRKEKIQESNFEAIANCILSIPSLETLEIGPKSGITSFMEFLSEQSNISHKYNDKGGYHRNGAYKVTFNKPAHNNNDN